MKLSNRKNKKISKNNKIKIQYIAAFPWTFYEKRRALNICLKTNGLFGSSSSGQSFLTEITLKKERNMLKNYSKKPHIRTSRGQDEQVLVL